MSIFGKILAVLNIFGMVGLFILAMMAYSKRQGWAYVAYRHDLAITGLPVHKEERDQHGNLKYLDVGKKTQADLFPSNPVTTQKEEVERVQKALQDNIDKAGSKPKETVLYATYLLPLARTNTQRERLLSLKAHLADDKAVGQLKTDFQLAYAGAMALKKGTVNKSIAWGFADRLNSLRGEPKGPLEEAFVAAITTQDRDKVMDPLATKVLNDTNKAIKDAGDAHKKWETDIKEWETAARDARAKKAVPPVQPVEPPLPPSFNETFTTRFLESIKADPGKTAFDEAFDKMLADSHTKVKDEFDREFANVLEGKRQLDGGQKYDLTLDERKDAISHLLFNLVEAEVGGPATDGKSPPEIYLHAGYKRYLAVVGLETANRTINREALKLSQIASDLDYERRRERTAFTSNLSPIIEASKQSARSVEKLAEELKRETEKVRQQTILVDQRKVNVDEATDELGMRRDAMAKKMADLRAMSSSVYDIRVAVRDATVVNQEHERTIRKLEGWRWLPFVGGKFLVIREE